MTGSVGDRQLCVAPTTATTILVISLISAKLCRKCMNAVEHTTAYAV